MKEILTPGPDIPLRPPGRRPDLLHSVEATDGTAGIVGRL